ncbi:hypothetical protein JZ751_025717 [Albula glossodonta]|uniref:Uncharacterized protein n=1 Tax=Albula glossodonta TaxID=121402 RepID=A0A8T2NDD5_9TELE|nr:hypothetical protein JZ751_025717 [Albula glossodonta]
MALSLITLTVKARSIQPFAWHTTVQQADQLTASAELLSVIQEWPHSSTVPRL